MSKFDESMSDDKTPPEPRDWSHIKTKFIPADDPIFSEGLIITFPIKPTAQTNDDKEEE
jgi:hypothetical protein